MTHWKRYCQLLCMFLLVGGCQPAVPPVSSRPEPVIIKYFQPAPGSPPVVVSPPGTMINIHSFQPAPGSPPVVFSSPGSVTIHYFQQALPKLSTSPVVPSSLSARPPLTHTEAVHTLIRLWWAYYQTPEGLARDALFAEIQRWQAVTVALPPDPPRMSSTTRQPAAMLHTSFSSGSTSQSSASPESESMPETDTPASEPQMDMPDMSSDASPQTFTCAKKTCDEVASCDEARYLLNECGMEELDQNHDGVPCEDVCQ